MSWVVIISTILILGGSIFISSNKNMGFDKKKIILLVNLGFLAIILLYQKISEPQPDTSVIGLEDQLYKPPKINSFKKENIKYEYQQIPDVNDYLDLLESNLEFKFDKKNKMGPVFALIAGEARTGKTFAVQKLAYRLINNDISQTMYIDLKNPEDQENIEKLLKNINYLPFYDWLNKKHENPPTIIIDHFEKANQEDYTYSNNVPKCYLCLSLKQLYIDFNVNILLISNSPVSKKLLDISGVSKYVLKKQFQRSLNQEQILMKNLVDGFQEPELKQKLGWKNIDFCYNYMDFRFDIFDDFLQNWKQYESFQQFCELKIDSWSKKYELNEETKKVAKFILEYQKQFSVENDNKQVNYVNQWVSYGFLKHKLNNDYKLLDQAISLGLEYALFEQQPGQIRFFGKLAQTSALLSIMENEIGEIKQVNYEIKKKEL